MTWPALVILDRDGVINEDSADYIRSPRDFRPITGSIDAIAALSQAGIEIAIATNQSGIARGYFSRRTLYRIHARLRRAVREAGGNIDVIAFCPHGPDDDCDCRKPRPGLLLQIMARLRRRPEEALMIGDSARDIDAAERAAVPAWLVRTGNGERTLASGKCHGTPVVADLADAARRILAERG